MFNLNNWSEHLNQEIRSKLTAVKFIIIPANRKPFIQWIYVSMLERLYRLLPNDILSVDKISFSLSKRSYQILRALKNIKLDFDWVIAHNPGAFYPAYFVAKHSSAKLGIDVEDYHPGETHDKKLQSSMKKLMLSILAASDYCSHASPLIRKEVLRAFPQLTSRQLVVLNCFSDDEFITPVKIEDSPLRLVWFSQNINYGRGLEFIIPVIHDLYPSVELHLIGKVQSSFANKHLQRKSGIIIHPILPQKELHKFLALFDVGLALDTPVNQNRDIALTNKIIAYAQAGLFILAFDTKGHRQFLESSNLDYVISDHTTKPLLEQVEKIAIAKNEIRLLSSQRFKIANSYSWELESQKLITIWRN